MIYTGQIEKIQTFSFSTATTPSEDEDEDGDGIDNVASSSINSAFESMIN